MTNVKILRGNIFNSKMMTIVNTVNCVGHMGAGIALEFKRRYPEMYSEYKEMCFNKTLKIGELHLWKKENPWILNFPTKLHYSDPSKISYIENGLDRFSEIYKEQEISSIAFPQLGTSHGKLDWDNEVKPLMVSSLEKLEGISIEIYEYDPYAEDELFNTFKIIINNLPEKDLKNDIGISPVLASRIKAGLGSSIQNLGDLQGVKGLGEETLGKIYAYVKNPKQPIKMSLFDYEL